MRTRLAHRLEWWRCYSLNRQVLCLGLAAEAGDRETIRGTHLLLGASLWGLVHTLLGGKGGR